MEVNDPTELVGPGRLAAVGVTSILYCPEPLVVHAERPIDGPAAATAASVLRQAPTVTIVVGHPDRTPDQLASAADVCATAAADPPAPWIQGDPSTVAAAVSAHPEAALALVTLLRTSERLDPWSAVATEAATYAMLLGSRDHREWLKARGHPLQRSHDRPAVAVERANDHLAITLDRAEARNAIDTLTRDALVDALAIAAFDSSIMSVGFHGAGPDFCAGGDLREFGTTTDPATALAVRLTSHPGLAAHRIADRLTAHLHGNCIGAGVEVPAFAHHLVAHPDTKVSLPELSLGLVPGAGGTCSIARRIGRQRTNWLALTGVSIDAPTALAWGLVDRVTGH